MVFAVIHAALTWQRKRRTCGPENFQSSAKTDFFNTIRQKRTFPRGQFLIRNSYKFAAIASD
jgi:hypothetical protein